MDNTVETIAWAYNKTPKGFKPPADEVIDYVIKVVDKQIEIDRLDINFDVPKLIMERDIANNCEVIHDFSSK